MHPDGYGTAMISLEQMKAKHGPKMHPEFSRRFFAYMDHKGFGVGGGWRAVQPVKPGFAPPGKSFHESQTFASGISAYCAIDLVVAVPGGNHRSPTWAECADAPQYGLHTFVNGEPWHIQCVEMRGFDSWLNAGRPDPPFFTLPGVIPPTPPQELPMKYYALPPDNVGNRPHLVVWDGACRYRTNGDTDPLPEIRLPEEQYQKICLSAGIGPQ